MALIPGVSFPLCCWPTGPSVGLTQKSSHLLPRDQRRHPISWWGWSVEVMVYPKKQNRTRKRSCPVMAESTCSHLSPPCLWFHLIPFLSGRLCWQRIPSATVCPRKSSSLLHVCCLFLLHIWQIFLCLFCFTLQHFKNATPLSSCSHDFWWEVCSPSHPCSSVADACPVCPQDSSLSLVFSSLKVMC